MGDNCTTRSICETSDPSFGSNTTANDASHATVSINLLNDDVLLVIFAFCRVAGKDKVQDAFSKGTWNWDRPRWWHDLTQVCQRWRSLILTSPYHLHLHIVCTKGTPVAEKLVHFLHLPLEVMYAFEEGEKIRPHDERNIFLALQHSHRVRCVNLSAATPALQKMIIPLNEEFPLLDSLAITSVIDGNPTGFTLPISLRAPKLRYLMLKNFAPQTGTPILTTPMIHLVVLALEIITSTHIPRDYLADLLECTPQLQILSVNFHPSTPYRDVGTHRLAPEAHKTFITLLRLEHLYFIGANTYLEGILARINAPALKLLFVNFINQRSYNTLPNLSRFLDTTAKLRFRVALITFHRHTVTIEMGIMRSYQYNRFPFCLTANGNQLDWQIASASEICSAIVPAFSVTEELVLGHRAHEISSVTRSNDNRVKWHKILRLFSNVKTLVVEAGLVEELSLHLQPDGEEALLGLLPRLKRIEVPLDAGDVFSAFINSRRIAGHPVHLIRKRALKREL